MKNAPGSKCALHPPADVTDQRFAFNLIAIATTQKLLHPIMEVRYFNNRATA